ncbi:DUF1552 domain-containing protein [Nannocystis sp. SCPEA4]|uniref:DUF1552 domain-containing protein n=1 Tax=Nannocystis sp. SCPEA4 TaxID=2996787 RepID=UPI00226FCB3B|nr:DUF1552 domain-containing protein [Nannocystis sp. SCPEA4]MCY1061424.1 DUF1552 domain-containing protein [Nannocystis sp. SCPEA4]
MSNRRTIPRRTFLRGLVGGSTAVLGLPLLEAMLDRHGEALADGSPLPTRFVTWFFGNGVILPRFEPAATGPNYPLSEQLQPLANVRDYVTVLTGLRNRCETTVTHHEGMTVFNGYTMAELNGLFSKAGGPTIDQLIAAKIGQDTPIASVHLGVSKHLSVMDSGTTMHALSHKGTNEPQYPQFNPQQVWTDLFGTFAPNADDRALRSSILDAVRDQTAKLRTRLGTLDNQRLDAHLDGVSALEKKIEATVPMCALPEKPTETNVDVGGVEPITAVNDLMSDLLVYAFQCDITRVASMLFHGGAAETVFSEIGLWSGHHNNSHAQDSADLQAGILHIMARFADMLEKFKAAVDIDGKNLLDTSIIYCSSDCSEGWTHSIERQPIILAGHGRNQLVYPGIHVQAAPYPQSDGNTSDVLLTCLQAFDKTATSIGAGAPMSTTPMEEIMGTAF